MISTYFQDKRLLDYVSPNVNLEILLGEVTDSFKSVGTMSAYFQTRYDSFLLLRFFSLISFGFKKDTIVIASSGDNPCTLAGLNIRLNEVSASLGTSDTLIGLLIRILVFFF